MTSKKRTQLFGLRNFTFFKLLFNHRELEKTFNMWKERFCSIFPTPYYMPHSDKWFRNAIENTIHIFCVKKKRFSKLLLNRLYFAKNLSWVMILVSIVYNGISQAPFGQCWRKFNLVHREVQRTTSGAGQVVIRILF